MKLCLPSIEFKDAFIAMMLDYQRNGEHKYQIESIEMNDVFEKYITRIREKAQRVQFETWFCTGEHLLADGKQHNLWSQSIEALPHGEAFYGGRAYRI